MRSVLVALALCIEPAVRASRVSGAVCDAVSVCGALPDNHTDAAPALSACVAPSGPCGAPNSVLTIPAGASFCVGSVDLSNTVIRAPQEDSRGMLRFATPKLGSEEWEFLCEQPVVMGDRVIVKDVSGNTLIVTRR